MIRLYRAPYSTNVERVAIALAHKGLEVESVVIDYADRSPVEAVSGQGLVPVIVDDGEVVVDSTAILRHLDERYPDRPLFPDDPARRAEAERERIAALGARITGWVEVFERLLTGRDHLLGDALSAADCAAYPFLKFAVGDLPADDDDPFHAILAEYQSVDGHPRLAGWIERMRALPQV